MEKRPSEAAIRNQARIKEMVTYVRGHYAERIRVSDIAHSAAISESECARCFRKMVGTTPMRYLRQFRLQQARNMLADPALKAVDIAARCGFDDGAHLARAFREAYGYTPSEYRERIRTV